MVGAVADGCNWGVKPHEAACRASAAFVQYVTERASRMPDLREAAACVLRAFNYAHHKIIEGKYDPLDAGTTTLLGGVLLELAEVSVRVCLYALVCMRVRACMRLITRTTRSSRVMCLCAHGCGLAYLCVDERDALHIDITFLLTCLLLLFCFFLLLLFCFFLLLLFSSFAG